MRKIILLMPVIVFAFSSCQKNNTPAPAKVPSSDLRNLPSATTAVTPGTDVYVVGSYAPPGGTYAAGYWKNGTFIGLNNSSDAFDIAVSGNDVYVVGISQEHAAYWKNGVIHYLNFGANSSFISYAFSIAINGSDVYIVGDYTALNIDADGDHGPTKPIVWKNEVPQDLSYNALPASLRGIAIIGSDVYVAGYSTVNPNLATTATYWKNGVPTRLASSQITSWASDIAANGSDVYISGYTSTTANSPTTALYWKNGVLTPIRSNASTSAITINNNNVYVAGFANYSDGNNQAVSWKNGAATVYGPLNTLVTRDIAVSGSDTYVLVQSGLFTTPAAIYYYKNGAAFQVSANANGSRMLVVQH